jgi:hypothetical protein
MTDDHIIKRAVGARDKILWTGRPVQGLRLTRADSVLIPLSLAFTALLFLLYQSMRANDAPQFVYVPLTLLVAVAAYLLGGRYFYDAFRRSQLSYGLTNRQVVIVHGSVGATTQWLDLSTLPAMTLVPDAGSAASIWFGTQGQGAPAAPYFDRIENAQAVRERILAAQGAAQRT